MLKVELCTLVFVRDAAEMRDLQSFVGQDLQSFVDQDCRHEVPRIILGVGCQKLPKPAS